MMASNRNPYVRLELFDVSNANPVPPVLRIQPKDGCPRRQITQFHSSREWMNVHRCIMNRRVEGEIQLRGNLRHVDMVTWRDDPMVHQAIAGFVRTHFP